MNESPSPGSAFATLTELLEFRAAQSPEQRAYVHLADGETETAALTYRELAQRAHAIARRLAADTAPGDRALLLYPPGLDFMTAFFGCLLAGVIAVPSYPPKRNRPDPRLQVIADDAGARLVLTDRSVLAEIEPRLENTPELRALRWLATDDPATLAVTDADEASDLPVVQPADLAFLQYTSGSTATPKGVMVSHANLLHNLDDLDRGWDHDAHSVMVTWLPIFHDMGLIYGALMPLFRGFLCVMLPPASFLQRPVRWLEVISRYRGTHSAAPNFAYDLCVAATTAEQRAALDLSSWHMSLNAAEPVRAHTLEAFNAAFAPAGLDPLTVKPGFGLAEATLKVTALPRTEPVTITHVDADALARHEVQIVAATADHATALVGCGWGQVDNRVCVVDPDTHQPCPPDRVGEIWFSGPSVAQGYWQRDEATAETFHATLADDVSTRWMRTGDLGFARGREIYVTGRVKDLIILRGLNHYPQDIELTVERAHPAIRPSCTAAFALETAQGEALAVVCEVERTHLRRFDLDAVVSALCTAVIAAHELPLHTLVFLKPASIPKTSSGKIQRRLARQRWLDGEFKPVATWEATAAPAPTDETAPPPAVAELEAFLRTTLARLLKRDPTTIDLTAPFATQGLDSLTAVELSGALEDHLGRRLPPTLAYDFPYLRALAQHLTKSDEPLPAAPPPPPSDPTEPIAVIGLGCRFPGAPSVDAYWDLLRSGTDAIGPVPPDRWDTAATQAPPHGGFIDHVADFDAAFFGLSTREADLMDPQQRLLLETSWEALEHAGLNPTTLAGSLTGVFVGISTQDYRLLLARSPQSTAAHTGTGNALSIAANRLSYWLDLQGPSFAIDTACSSSLVALHQAVRALRAGDCRLALVGGVNLLLAPDVSETFAEAGMLAPDGRCKTFDASADGYVRGEGAGVVVLKPLSAAQRDGDNIYAVVRGSAINQDGRSNGLTAPNGPAQQAVVRAALQDARLTPADLSFVETHGTGTALGDPIEVNALHAVLSRHRANAAPCFLGAVKTQIGHLEAAAGIAGFIKTALALHHGAIPANLHLSQPNRHLAATADALALPTATTAWTGPGRCAGVSSFGFGGTNAHVVLAAAPARATTDAPAPGPRVYPLSARDESALTALATAHANALEALPADAWSDAAGTMATGRATYASRLAVVADSAADAATQLRTIAPATVTTEPRIAFLFSGQGSLYASAGRDLRTAYPIFNDSLQQLQAEVQRLAGWDLLAAMDAPEKIVRTEFGQVVLFALELSLARLWQSWGLQPTAVAGHSVGEYAAAVIAGALSSSDALQLLLTRARLMGELGDTGAMAAIMAPLDQVEPLATAHGAEIGARNSARQTVVTGAAAAVAATVAAAEAAGLRAARLSVAQGYHSAEMEPMLPAFTTAATNARLGSPQLTFISSCTGRAETDALATPDYWVQQIRRPVLWADTARALAATGCNLVIEVGPRNLLAALSAQSWPEDQPVEWLASLQPDQADATVLLGSAARAWTLGAPVRWSDVPGHRPHQHLPLPTYPFQRERHWFSDTRDALPELDATLAQHLATDPTLTDPERAAVPAILAALRRSRGHAPTSPIVHDLHWQSAPLAEVTDRTRDTWLLLGEAPELASALCNRGATVVTHARFEPGNWTHVLHVAGKESPNTECHRLLHTVQALATAPGTPILHVLTRGAVPAVPMDGRALQLHHAPLWGMGLSFALEQPERWGGLIDLPPTTDSAELEHLVDTLLTPSDEDQIALRPTRYVPRLRPAALPTEVTPFTLNADATYWITGGLGGIGLQLARWLVDHGARHLILSARRAPSAAAQTAIDDLRAHDTSIEIASLDVADRSAIDQLLDQAQQSGHPVRGILHAAGVLHNQPLAEVTPETIDSVLHPKVAGGLALHAATRSRDLDFLVFFSSIASAWGSKWQLHYSAANRFLDALAAHRRATALPAVSINWGPWSGGGMAGSEEQALLQRMGIRALTTTENLDCLNKVLFAELIQAVVAAVDWPTFRSLVELQRPKPLLAELGFNPSADSNASTTPTGPAPIVGEWTDLPPADRADAITRWLQQELAGVLGLKAGRLPDPREGFFALGLDSLLAVELRNRLSRALALSLPATLAFDHGNILALAPYLAGKLWPAAAVPITPTAPTLPPDAPPPPLVDANASDDEVDAALAARLARLEALTRDV